MHCLTQVQADCGPRSRRTPRSLRTRCSGAGAVRYDGGDDEAVPVTNRLKASAVDINNSFYL